MQKISKILLITLFISLYNYTCLYAIESSCNSKIAREFEEFFNSFKTAKSNFTQYTESSVATGILYISKPHNMKIEYNSPRKISALYMNKILSYFDHELSEESHVKLSNFLITLLIKPKISFCDFCASLNTYKVKNAAYLECNLNETQDAKSIQIIIENNTLKQISIHKEFEEAITIKFQDAVYNINIPTDIFSIKNTSMQNIREN
ncbi:MAG: outer-membrane lipoprotein carrier protein LolA [Proteobacteria bacterium]|nr:outer-membrane lipoprotein carrier protein LolA [Pseudomonadota bacterium]